MAGNDKGLVRRATRTMAGTKAEESKTSHTALLRRSFIHSLRNEAIMSILAVLEECLLEAAGELVKRTLESQFAAMEDAGVGDEPRNFQEQVTRDHNRRAVLA